MEQAKPRNEEQSAAEHQLSRERETDFGQNSGHAVLRQAD